MKFDIPKNGKINPEPSGLMIVKDNATAAQYAELFPLWTILSVTKITAKQFDTYAELFAGSERIVFWHPAEFIKVKNKRYALLQALTYPVRDKLEVYGFNGGKAYAPDTVEQAMAYLPCLFPHVKFPTDQMQTHLAWEWRNSRYLPAAQVQVLKWSNTPTNMDLIKSAINH